MARAARRRQILEATIRVVAQHGVRGASTARIAREAGIAEGTLYRHFESRSEIIFAAVESWFLAIHEFTVAARHPDAIQWLLNIMRAHLAYFGSHEPDLSRVFLQFASASPGDGVSDHLYRHQTQANDYLAHIVQIGKDQGTIRAEVDPDQAAWQLVVVLWADQITWSMNPEHTVESQRTIQLYEQVIRSLRADPPA